MSEPPSSAGAFALLTLPRSRRLLRTRVGALTVAFVAVLYGFVSLIVGGMLVVTRTTFPSVQTQVVVGQGEGAWWNYPAVIVTAPNGVLVLPFLATVTMVVVSLGVGIGMEVGLVLAYRLLRRGGTGSGRPGTVGSLSGLTPAMIALVTLGACCSTTAAATAGIGVVAQASGTTLEHVLVNSWYLDVFQVAVLGVALVAQEQLLAVYGRILGAEPRAEVAAPRTVWDGRYLAGAALRAGLLVGGVTWSLAMLAEWTAVPPPSPTVALVAQWTIQHQLPALFAIGAGLFAVPTYRALRRISHRPLGLLLRSSLLLAGVSLVAWTPAPLAGAGVFGWVNEALGAAGAPPAWGAVAPPALGPLSLALRWGLQFGLLGVFAMVAAVSPERAFLPLQWTTEPRSANASFSPTQEEFRVPTRPADASPQSSLGSGDSTGPVPGLGAFVAQPTFGGSDAPPVPQRGAPTRPSQPRSPQIGHLR